VSKIAPVGQHGIGDIRYLIDTDIIIYHLNGVSEAETLLQRLRLQGIAMSVITYMEYSTD
jgi:predicted nucleic acid-binding protein